MRRSVLAVTGIAAVLAVAACAPDRADQSPLAPTVPLLAAGDQCAGGLASTIAKQQKALFTSDALNDLQAQFAVIKNQCSSVQPPPAAVFGLMMTYIESMIGYSGAPTDAARAVGLKGHLASVTLYVTANAVDRPAEIFQNQGGAAVLSPGEFMTTWDNLARLEIQAGTTPSAPHLWTFESRPTGDCDGTTSLRITGNCYQVHDYPDETTDYSPRFIVTLCHPSSTGPGEPLAIGHQTSAFNGKAEVLDSVFVPFSCSHTTAAIDSWLGRDAGPLGRALARAYDYLRPRPLFADDAGESGLAPSASLFGGILNVIFEDDFSEINNPPDIGDSWLVLDADGSGPGYIRVQSGLGNLTGSVVVLSQGQGACDSCPVFKLLGTRVNPSPVETVGTYDVTWQQLQNKPNIKEAPFVVLNDAGAEIARLSWVTESNHNKLRFTAGGVTTDSVGTWVQNVSQSFKITVNLTTLNPATSNRVSLEINGNPVATNPNVIPNATSLRQIGFILDGIDAGIIAADNFRVIRNADIPPSP